MTMIQNLTFCLCFYSEPRPLTYISLQQLSAGINLIEYFYVLSLQSWSHIYWKTWTYWWKSKL